VKVNIRQRADRADLNIFNIARPANLSIPEPAADFYSFPK
jgi:hypothetical protein